MLATGVANKLVEAVLVDVCETDADADAEADADTEVVADIVRVELTTPAADDAGVKEGVNELMAAHADNLFTTANSTSHDTSLHRNKENH